MNAAFVISHNYNNLRTLPVLPEFVAGHYLQKYMNFKVNTIHKLTGHLNGYTFLLGWISFCLQNSLRTAIDPARWWKHSSETLAHIDDSIIQLFLFYCISSIVPTF